MSVIAVVSLVFLHDLFEMVILDVPCFIVTLLLFILAFVLSHYFNLFSKDVLEYLDMKLSKK